MTPALAILSRLLRIAPQIYPAICIEPEWRALLTDARDTIASKQEP